MVHTATHSEFHMRLYLAQTDTPEDKYFSSPIEYQNFICWEDLQLKRAKQSAVAKHCNSIPRDTAEHACIWRSQNLPTQGPR